MALGLTQPLPEMSKVRHITGLRGSRDIALLFFDLGAGRGKWSAPRPGRFTPGKEPVPLVQEAGWAPGPVWTCAKNLAPIGIRSPDRPSRSKSLYRLRYPAHSRNEYQEYFLGCKDGRCVWLTTLPPSCADFLKIWEPQPPGALRACQGL
jgi:hypothetical protein